METPAPTRSPDRTAAVALAIVVVAVFAASILVRHRLAGAATTPAQALLWALAASAAWLPLVPLVSWAEARIHVRASGLVRWLGAHLLTAVAVCVAYAALRSVLDLVVPGLARPGLGGTGFRANLLRAVPQGFLVYAVLAATAAALRHRAEARRFAGGATPLVAPAEPPAAPPEPPRYLARLGARETVVPAAEIRWAEAAGNYVALHAASGRHLVRATLAQLEGDLAPFGGLRVHRGALVRRDAVRALHAPAEGPAAVELVDGTRVEVSRRFLPAVRAALHG